MAIGSPHDSPWRNETTCDRVKALWKDHSASAISDILARENLAQVSRNSVVGFLHRQKLTLEQKDAVHPQTRENGSRRPRVAARKNSPPLPPGAPKFNAEIFVCAEAVDIVPRHLSLSDLEESDCRYPYGDGPFTFCGHQNLDGSSYCSPHHRLCAAGIPARKNIQPTTFGQSKGGVFGRVA